MTAKNEPIHTVVRGTMILTLAVLASKILGFIYVVPLEHLIGLEGLTLLNHGYTPYTVLLSLTTLGIPLAVSKYVATHNQLGEYRKGKRLLKRSFYLLLGLGVVMYLLVFWGSPLFAKWLQSPESTWIIRASASALLVVPAMAVLRGYFQGWQSMGPTGVSQVIEQLVRVVFMVLMAYLFVQANYTIVNTVALASLGTLLGAIAALVTLLIYWYKRREGIHKKVLASPSIEDQPLLVEYRDLIRYALPISFVSLAIPLMAFIDLVMYKPILYDLGYSREVVVNWFGILSSTAQKLIMVPVSIATAFSLSILPSLAKQYVQGDKEYITKQTEQSMLLLCYILLPASVGIYVLAEPIYTTLYSDALGVTMLEAYTPTIIALGLYTLTASILQAIGKMKWSMSWLIVALLLKGLGMLLLLPYNAEVGAIHATTIAFTIGLLGNLWGILRTYTLSYKRVLTGLGAISLAALIMGLAVYAGNQFSDRFLPDHLFLKMLELIVLVLLGVAVYFGLTYRIPWVKTLQIGRRKKLKQ
ncbi:putative polysaccharide biosynthesis protein [Bacillus horti]|uniref:O-antigen/teichoic acid export membrane protein n=2 Tax=Caldalkalibacillus horti TaxID=77523 RepID=A0ABT9VWP3_9BACI|nr:polysaccharide biosynthesis protein [Bacillus horti]MDQ0165415.1 O-antigen/teichoic acid export membrane protein [Bacillus horti]